MARTIDNYTPNGIPAWPDFADHARGWARLAEPTDQTRAYEVLVAVARFCAWLHRVGHPIDDTALDEAVVNRFIAADCAHMRLKSQYNYRSLLRRVAVAAGVTRPPQVIPGNSRHDRNPPYTPAEQALLWTWATAQHPDRADDLRLAVAASLGAGMDAGDLRTTCGTDVTVAVDGTVTVHVQGARQRRTVVLAEWADEVARAAARAAALPLFRPTTTRSRSDRNIVTTLIRDVDSRDGLPDGGLDLRRARTTWVVRHLSAGTPLAVLARAAGVSLRSLHEIIQFVSEPVLDDGEEDRLLSRPRALR